MRSHRPSFRCAQLAGCLGLRLADHGQRKPSRISRALGRAGSAARPTAHRPSGPVPPSQTDMAQCVCVCVCKGENQRMRDGAGCGGAVAAQNGLWVTQRCRPYCAAAVTPGQTASVEPPGRVCAGECVCGIRLPHHWLPCCSST